MRRSPYLKRLYLRREGTPTILGVNLMEKLLKALANELIIDFKNVFFNRNITKTMSREYI